MDVAQLAGYLHSINPGLSTQHGSSHLESQHSGDIGNSLRVQGCPQLHSDFQTKLGYYIRPISNNNNDNNWKKNLVLPTEIFMCLKLICPSLNVSSTHTSWELCLTVPHSLCSINHRSRTHP